MTPKLLILYKVARLENNEIYNMTKLYCHRFQNVDSYFVVCDEKIEQDMVIENRIIKVKKKEDNWNGLLVKVIKAYNVFKTSNYTHVIVSGVSTIVNIPVMYKLISTCSPNVKCMSYLGEYTFKDVSYKFPSGSCWIFTMDLVFSICDFFDRNNFIVDNQLTEEFLNAFPPTDDIFFGYYLHINKTGIKPIARLDATPLDFVFNAHSDKYYSHYKIKSGNRIIDIKFFDSIIRNVYPYLFKK